MMKILDVQQIRDLDTYTILHEPIASIDLMERASVAFTQYILKHFGRQYSFMIFCGLGNNGGDGLAIARLLIGYQYQVKVWVVDYTEKQSDDFRWNYERLAQVTTIQHIQTEEGWQVSTSTPADCIVIDALLGSGINRPVEGLLAKVIEGINALPYTKVAVDIASGLYANQPINTQNTIICPDLTISFQLPKMAFLLPENQQYVGHWEVLDIGLSKTDIKDVPTPYY
jgi:NAD(P)H-hydrate epimerase